MISAVLDVVKMERPLNMNHLQLVITKRLEKISLSNCQMEEDVETAIQLLLAAAHHASV